jgi:hypothetical protein
VKKMAAYYRPSLGSISEESRVIHYSM